MVLIAETADEARVADRLLQVLYNDNSPLDQVDCFKYLGFFITSPATIDKNIL